MRTAIYIEDGVVQLVITPESEFEKNALSTMADKAIDAKIFQGSFYDCRGGWVAQAKVYKNLNGLPDTSDKSLIIKVMEAETKFEPEPH